MEENQDTPVKKTNLSSSISNLVFSSTKEKLKKPVALHAYHSIGGGASSDRHLTDAEVEALKQQNQSEDVKKLAVNRENNSVVHSTGDDMIEDGTVTCPEIPKEQKITSKPDKASIGSSKVTVVANVEPVSIFTLSPNVSQLPSLSRRPIGLLQSSSPQDIAQRSAPLLLPKAITKPGKPTNNLGSLLQHAAASGSTASNLSQPNIQPTNMFSLLKKKSQSCTGSGFSVSTSSLLMAATNTAQVKQPFNCDDASKNVEPPNKKFKSE